MLRAEPCQQATQLLSTALQLRMCLTGCIHASSDQGAQSINPHHLARSSVGSRLNAAMPIYDQHSCMHSHISPRSLEPRV